jgi:hypothetical protein
MTGRLSVLSALLALLAVAGVTAQDDPSPRVLVLALDGIPFRLMERARADGAFEGWSEPRRLIPPFPSITNVSFTAILSPLGAERVRGYEVRHYDPEENRIHGGGWSNKKKTFAWKDQFDVISRGNFDKARIYMTPKGKAQSEIRDVEEMVLESKSDMMLAHVAATDMMMHFRGDDDALELLEEIAERLVALRQTHLEERGRPLRLVLLSDHGNTSGKVRAVKGLRGAVKGAGLNLAKRLEEPGDVVLVTYGLVGYTVLYSDPANAETIATATRAVEGVALSAWRSGDGEVTVLTEDGRAVVRWRSTSDGRRFAYEPREGDPLALREILGSMTTDGLVGSDGYADEDDWFERTVLAEYPDGAIRLADALSGRWVETPATVILAMKPGYASGVSSVKVGSWFMGGRLEGTHGGLDLESSTAFLLDSDPTRRGGHAVRADRVLAELSLLNLVR